ncbi:MAG: Gfo/Idh/MocA family oxidoreductase, partial [Planctomycetes bacterium]|nr:Gfo/Idh/MocA family oxidoreductase [Planctomycetota bacterium]
MGPMMIDLELCKCSVSDDSKRATGFASVFIPWETTGEAQRNTSFNHAAYSIDRSLVRRTSDNIRKRKSTRLTSESELSYRSIQLSEPFNSTDSKEIVMHRREFIASSALSASALLASGSIAKAAASERIRVGCVGTGGRALSLIKSFSKNPKCEIVSLADLDASKFGPAISAIEANQGKKPTTVADFRKLIDDKSLDVIVVGTPDHWHAIPTIMACQAGKDVYVEKPDGHNIVEGQRMVAALKKHDRIVQMGTQARTTERMEKALEFIRTGALGRCLVARAWES